MDARVTEICSSVREHGVKDAAGDACDDRRVQETENTPQTIEEIRVALRERSRNVSGAAIV